MGWAGEGGGQIGAHQMRETRGKGGGCQTSVDKKADIYMGRDTNVSFKLKAYVSQHNQHLLYTFLAIILTV